MQKYYYFLSNISALLFYHLLSLEEAKPFSREPVHIAKGSSGVH